MCNSFKNMIVYLVLGMLLSLPLSDVYAKAGCCSKHGGVAGCDAATGFLKCKDGTDSKTCNCNGGTTTPTKSTKVTKTTKTTKAVSTEPATPAAATTTVATVPAVTLKAPKGCCSKHGGVGACNKKRAIIPVRMVRHLLHASVIEVMRAIQLSLRKVGSNAR